MVAKRSSPERVRRSARAFRLLQGGEGSWLDTRFAELNCLTVQKFLRSCGYRFLWSNTNHKIMLWGRDNQSAEDIESLNSRKQILSRLLPAWLGAGYRSLLTPSAGDKTSCTDGCTFHRYYLTVSLTGTLKRESLRLQLGCCSRLYAT